MATKIYISTSAPFYWAAETMAIARGYLSSRLDRSQVPVPKWMIMDTFKGEVSFAVKNPPASGAGGTAVATSISDVTAAVEVLLETDAEPPLEPPPGPAVLTFGNITTPFGEIVQTFGEL